MWSPVGTCEPADAHPTRRVFSRPTLRLMLPARLIKFAILKPNSRCFRCSVPIDAKLARRRSLARLGASRPGQLVMTVTPESKIERDWTSWKLGTDLHRNRSDSLLRCVQVLPTRKFRWLVFFRVRDLAECGKPCLSVSLRNAGPSRGMTSCRAGLLYQMPAD